MCFLHAYPVVGCRGGSGQRHPRQPLAAEDSPAGSGVGQAIPSFLAPPGQQPTVGAAGRCLVPHLLVSSRRSGRLGDVSFLRLARELSRTYCASVRQRERSCFRQLLFCVCFQGLWRVGLHAYKPIIPAVKTKQPQIIKQRSIECCFVVCLAVRTRLELATPCVTGMYSNQTELPDRF